MGADFSPAWRLACPERVHGGEEALEVGVGAGRREGRGSRARERDDVGGEAVEPSQCHRGTQATATGTVTVEDGASQGPVPADGARADPEAWCRWRS